MRPISIPITMLAAVLAWPAAAQVGAEQNALPPSLLAPRMPESLPAPTPIAPEINAQPPPGFAPVSNTTGQTTPALNAPPPPSDLGTVTAVPLPPPGTEPSQAPRGPSETATTVAPVIGAPISLAPPRPQPPPLQPNPPPSSVQFAQPPVPGAKIPPAALVSNNLPAPALSPEASPADFLRAARGALAAGRNGEVRSALEMAQTRLLSRVVDAGKEQEPSDNAAVKQISEAINALAANDRPTCLRYIEFASQTLGSPLD